MFQPFHPRLKRLVTAAALAAGALVVLAADLALGHIDEIEAVAATYGFRMIYGAG